MLSKNTVFQSCLFLFPDKQQDLDIPQVNSEQNDKSAEKTSPMTKITGVRKLKHTNSYTTVPKYGVETRHPEELGKVLGQGSKRGVGGYSQLLLRFSFIRVFNDSEDER